MKLSQPLIAIIGLTIWSCDPCLNVPCADSIPIRLENKISGKPLLLAPTAIYEWDSLKVSFTPFRNAIVEHYIIPYTMDDRNGIISLHSYSLFDTIILQLNSKTIDTLVLKLTELETECCNKYDKIAELRYKGIVITRNSKYYERPYILKK